MSTNCSGVVSVVRGGKVITSGRTGAYGGIGALPSCPW
jgi:hypothetical protein